MKINIRSFLFLQVSHCQQLLLCIMCRLAGVHGPKAKGRVFCWTKKFEKLLLEVLPDEAVDDKVDGGVEHERQLVDWGDRQPKLPAVKNSSQGYQKSHTICFVLLVFRVFFGYLSSKFK